MHLHRLLSFCIAFLYFFLLLGNYSRSFVVKSFRDDDNRQSIRNEDD
jgi:hypothetical protein